VLLTGTEAAFRAALGALNPPAPWGVAVSGGSDSLALMHLSAAEAARRSVAPPVVLHVDHGLRPESAREAETVAGYAQAAGLRFHALGWSPGTDTSRIQERARAGRALLLGRDAMAFGLASLFTGHTRDDQAETVAMRAARGSGGLGLAGIAPVSDLLTTVEPCVRLIRPLLDTTRAQLRDYLRGLGQAWLEDPSNANPRFARAALRLAGPVPFDEAAHRRAVADRVHLETEAAQALGHLSPDAFATLTVDPALLRTEAPLADVILSALLRRAGGADHPGTREERVRLLARLTGPGFRGATLARARIVPLKDGRLHFTRENRALPYLRVLEPRMVWDGRFDLVYDGDSERVFVLRMGPGGAKARPDIAAAVPARVIATAPVVMAFGHLKGTPADATIPLHDGSASIRARTGFFLPFARSRKTSSH
jgi:tRNA(Ile)-lysidine synthase